MFPGLPAMAPKKEGEMAEWFKAAVLKTVEVKASGGSNPSLSALFPLEIKDSGLNGSKARISAFRLICPHRVSPDLSPFPFFSAYQPRISTA